MASRWAGLARLAGATFRECLRPLSTEACAAAIRRRMETRETRFLAAVDATVYAVPGSPVRRLLEWAGCGPGDLAASVRRHGLEGALSSLAAAGVRVGAEELAGRSPVIRPGLEIEAGADAFANPLLAGRGITARTSGSTAPARTVPFDWPLFVEEAAAEGLLLACHGVERARIALWYPAPPGIAGVHNVLLHWKLGRAPDRWFSQVRPPRWSEAPDLALALGGLYLAGAPLRSPRARFTPLDRAIDVARWLEEGRRRGERRLLKAFASSAVRMAHAARAASLDVSGQVVFTGGESLTSDRRRVLADAGLDVHARFGATETGLVAGGCGRGSGPDGMHVHLDRVAVLAGTRPPGAAVARGPLAFTSLSTAAPLVLLNAELGDEADVRRGPCDCPFAAVGFDVHVSDVRAPAKIAGEGVKLPAGAVAAAAAEALVDRGGCGDDVQVTWTDESDGRTRVTIAVSPRIEFDEAGLRAGILARLERHRGGPLAAALWRDGHTILIVRRDPAPTAGQKVLPWSDAAGGGGR